MWAHKDWKGLHFPGDMATSDSLSVYATWCTAVEGNTTFYATPSAETITKWRDQSPESFRFCFKLPRLITHDRRLRDCDAELASFLRAIDPLGPRLGPLQIQLPASFDDAAVLIQFLDRLPLGYEWAVEVRHNSFFDGGAAERPLNDSLAERGINRVIFDSRPVFSGPCETEGEIDAFKSKPLLRVRPVATGRHPIVRFIGLTDEAATEQWWQQWLPKLADWLEAGLEPYFFVHTPDNKSSPVLNRRLHEAVQARVASLTPLPEPLTAGEQLGLWPN